MTSQLYSNTPHRLIADLADSIAALKKAAFPKFGSEFYDFEYRDSLSSALARVKQTSLKVFETGHINGLEKVGEIPAALKNLAGLDRDNWIANEIFWDQLSQAYPVKFGWDVKLDGLSHGLQLRLLKQMVEQDERPDQIIRLNLEQLQNDVFMDGFTTCLKLVLPPERKFSISAYEILFPLKARVHKQEFMPIAAEHIAAHQDLYFPFLERIMKVASLTQVLSTAKGQPLESAILDHKKMVLGLIGFSDKESSELIKQEKEADHLPTSVAFQRMRNALSLPAEFLALLYEMTKAPLVKRLAELAFDNPTGKLPYMHFERMGISKSHEWHVQAQEKAGLGRAVHLYEHAIMTPGLELSVRKVENQPITSGTPGILEALIAVLEAVPTSNPECRRKGQQLFDALVTNMEAKKSPPQLAEALKSSRISPVFYIKHMSLKSGRLENDLGL